MRSLRAAAVERELGFLGHDGRRRFGAAAHEAGDGAEVTAGADHDWRLDRLVDDPRVAGAPHRLDGEVRP